MQIPNNPGLQEHVIKCKPSWDDLVEEELRNPEKKDDWFQEFTTRLWEDRLVNKKPIETKPFHSTPREEAKKNQRNEFWTKFADSHNKKKSPSNIQIVKTMSEDGHIVLMTKHINPWHEE